MDAFREDPDLGFCYTGFVTMDAEGRDLRDLSDVPTIHPDLFVSVFWANPVNGSTVMMPKAIFDEVGPFDETLRADVDGDMWLRVLKTRRARYLPGASLRYRVHGAALVGGQAADARRPSRRSAARGSATARWWRGSAPPTRPRVAATLARMSAHYTKIGMPDVGRALLRASFRAGPAWPDQRPAAKAAVLAATPEPIKRGASRLRRAPRALVRRVRRLGRRIVGPR